MQVLLSGRESREAPTRTRSGVSALVQLALHAVVADPFDRYLRRDLLLRSTRLASSTSALLASIEGGNVSFASAKPAASRKPESEIPLASQKVRQPSAAIADTLPLTIIRSSAVSLLLSFIISGPQSPT